MTMSAKEVMRTLSNLWNEIPERIRKSIISWVLSFLFGLIITAIWGTTALLSILFILFVLAYTFRFRRAAQWIIGQFWGHSRGMTIMTLLPTIFVLVKDLTMKPSLDSLAQLIAAILIIGVLWVKFDEIIKDSINKKKLKRR